MKRVLIFAFTLSFFLIVFSIRSFAEDEVECTFAGDRVEYKIEQIDEKYRFLQNGIVFSESELLNDLLDGLYDLRAPIYCDNIFYDGDLTIDGEIVLSGRLTVKCIYVKNKAELKLDSIDINLFDGIEVHGGKCVLVDGSVFSQKNAIRLTGSSTSNFTMYGGIVKSEGNQPSLIVERGSAALHSGEVLNDAGAAISNNADLHLGNVAIRGVGYDVITENAIWASTDTASFNGKLHLKYDKLFEKGTSTVVLYNAGEISTNSVTVYDQNGMRETLVGLNGNLCIHKPFVARFVYSEEDVKNIEFLKNEGIEAQEFPQIVGYDFNGWSKDIDGESLFDFATVYNGDITLYASKTLKAPSYSINGINAVYDGTDFKLSFSEIKHELAGNLSFTWYSESGDIVSTNSYVCFGKVADSGKYKCKLSFTHGTDTTVVETPYLDVIISPKIIKKPTVVAAVYNGNIQYPLIDEVGFTYERQGFTNAGVYCVELTLDDSANTRWDDSNSTTTTVQFEIVKAKNKFIDDFSISDTYIGAEINWAAKTLFGEARIMYSESLDGQYLFTPPTVVGEYFAIVVVDGTQNYHQITSEPIKFRLLEDSVKRFTVRTYQSKGVYRSFELFNADGLTFDVLYESGKTETIDAAEVKFSYLSGDCFSVLHTAIYAEYCGHTLLLPITVKPSDYNIDLILSDGGRVYNSLYQTLHPVGNIEKGVDGSLPTFTVTGGGTDVGRYIVTVEFNTDSIEYNVPSSISAYLDIMPFSVDVVWSDLSFVYDGTTKCPTAHYVDIFGAVIPLNTVGGASFAGERYIAVALCDNPNYLLKNDSAEFEIERAKYDTSSAFWTQSGYVYSGETITVTLNGLPEGVRVVGYMNNTAINAGGYCATAILSGDEKNYHPLDNMEYFYCIDRADYVLDGFDIVGGEVAFDGKIHYPKVVGTIPVGIDGIQLEFDFSHGITNVWDESQIIVRFRTESQNYNCPTDFTIKLTVIPKGIYVEWENTAFVYNGTRQQPNAHSLECSINVSSDAINAGTYTATAATDNPNYIILNPNCEFVIERVQNFWTLTPQIFDVFFGREPKYVAEAAFGEIICEIYEDSDLSERAEAPLSCGKYYAVFRSDAGQNYCSLVSSPLSFSVIPIMPDSIVVNGKNNYLAFDALSPDDVSVILVNNDGSTVLLDFLEIDIEYMNCGESFRAGDSFVKFKYGDLSYDYSVSVEKAEYDFSELMWHNTEYIYDGESHTPTLTGLPYGVKVVEYLGGNVAKAGEYEITAVLSYDTDNFNQPQNPTAVMIISKCGIFPTAKDTVYNGLMQTPIPQNNLYRFRDVEYRDAGVYYVGVELVDNDNYYLVENVARFAIKPKLVSVTVNDSDAYWFEDASDFSLFFEKGITISLNELNIEYYVEDGEIFARADNPNYELSVTPGRIIRHNRFSPRVTRSMFISLLLYVILISAAVIIVIRREDVYALSRRLFKRKVIVATSGGAEYPALDLVSIDVERADALMTDSIAKTLIRHEDSVVTSGRKRCIINVDTLSEHFLAGERVDINLLKEKGLIPSDAGYLKVLGRGSVDKKLEVYANAFSLSAVKMIALTGGCAVIVKNKTK